jgi:hypothetical protein
MYFELSSIGSENLYKNITIFLFFGNKERIYLKSRINFFEND